MPVIRISRTYGRETATNRTPVRRGRFAAAIVSLSIAVHFYPIPRADAFESPLQAYHPSTHVEGEIVAWGEPAFEPVIAVWADAFQHSQPTVRFRWLLKGSSTSLGALYTGTANLALFGREIEPNEVVTWRRMFSYDPTGFAVATGSFDKYDQTVAPAILVNASNPIAHLSFAQLDAIYSYDRKRGAPTSITTWGQLGLTGHWANRPITIYGLDPTTGTAAFLRTRIMLDGRWSYAARLPEGAPHGRYAGSGRVTAASLVRAIERDPFAIGIGGFTDVTPKLKALPIGEKESGPFVLGTPQTVANRTYPLSRLVYVFVDHDPKRPWDPKLREFLSFVLSKDGQEAIARSGHYLPLIPEIVAAERAKLTSPTDSRTSRSGDPVARAGTSLGLEP